MQRLGFMSLIIVLATACTDDGKATSSAGSETSTGDGDGDGDGDGSPGDGDGDGVPGDGDGVPGDGDGDGVPGDGDGVPGDGDGDGVPGDGDGVPGDGDGDGSPGTCPGDPVLVCDAEPPSDPFTVDNIAIVDDCLELTVSYSGGCETHTFSPCWDTSFAESNPVQAWLWVDHDAMNDACDAIIQDMWIIDLGAIKQAWQDAYQAQSGTIVLHVAGETIDYDF
jgi:hypothetical protein